MKIVTPSQTQRRRRMTNAILCYTINVADSMQTEPRSCVVISTETTGIVATRNREGRTILSLEVFQMNAKV